MKVRSIRCRNGVLKRTSLVLFMLLFSYCMFSQVTIDVKDRSVKEILKEIEKTSPYKFFYNEDLKGLDKKVSFKVSNANIDDTMKKLLQGSWISYKKQDGDIIVLIPNTVQEEQQQIVTKKYTGTILDTKGESIIGANIALKNNMSIGSISDLDGKFSINVPVGATLVVSYIGYLPQEILLGNEETLRISLKEDTKLLDEIVVIGYGSISKGSVTGSVSSIKQKDLDSYSSGNVVDMLTGKSTGIQIIQPQGMPGANSSIRMRGIGSLTAGTNPLIVVDGFPLTENSGMNMINSSAIESIELLKDAASTAIYGSRGANGVIMIKTKSGKTGMPSISLNSYYGIQNRADNVELVDAYEMAQYMFEARNMGYVTKDPKGRSENDNTATRLSKGASKRELIPDYLIPYLENQPGLTNTNWLSEIFRTGSIQSHDISILGGAERMNYSFSGNFFEQRGIIIDSDFDRLSTNINLQIRPSDKFTFGFSMSPSFSKQNSFDTNGGNNYNLLSMALISYPFFSPYNADGSLAISEQIKTNTATDGALGENPLAVAKMTSLKNENQRIFGNIYADYKFLPFLTYKLSLGGDYESGKSNFFDPSSVGRYRTAAPDVTEAFRINNIRKNYLVENTLTFKRWFGDHSVEALLGQSYQYEDYENTQITAYDFPDNTITNISGGSTFKIEPSQYAWTMISYFSRLNYSYKDKYFFSASVRRDGSSRFGNNTKWSIFPALSGGWTISNEDFFPKNNILNYLKARTSWGKTGNNQIPNFGAKALLSDNGYIFGGSYTPGVSVSTSPNPNLSWEISQSVNIGLDLYLFDNSLSLTTDFYTTTTKNLLLEVPVPEQSGYSTSLQNLGKIRNWGLEMQIATAKDLKMGNVFWNSLINLSTNNNKVLELAPGQTQIISGTDNYARTRVGGPISELYGYKVAGVYKSQKEIDNTPHMTGTLVGDYIIEDINNDGVIDTKDKTGFGTPSPEVIIGFSNTFKYHDFEFSFDLYSELGKKIYSRTLAANISSGEGFAVATKDYFENRYHHVNNPDGKYATPNMGNFSNTRKQARVSNMYFDNASYLRLRSLKLAYNIPGKILTNIGLKNCLIYVSANNLLTFTPYKGFNIDSNSSSILAQGYDNANYPTAKTITFGVNLNF